MRYKLVIEYDGTSFAGWQVQPNAVTVQGCLNSAFQELFADQNITVNVVGSGRTDAGVHALGQVAHVDLPRRFRPYQIREAANFHLRPHPIAIVEAEEVSTDFHARFAAINRRYEYRILNRRAPSALNRHRAWHIGPPLDGAAMQRAVQHFAGTHDFSAFRAALCQATNPVRSVTHIDLQPRGAEWLLSIEARAFLHHQVRNIVGTVVAVGKGQMAADDIPRILESRDRAQAGPTAPPEGLCFMRVDYPEMLVKTWNDTPLYVDE